MAQSIEEKTKSSTRVAGERSRRYSTGAEENNERHQRALSHPRNSSHGRDRTRLWDREHDDEQDQPGADAANTEREERSEHRRERSQQGSLRDSAIDNDGGNQVRTPAEASSQADRRPERQEGRHEPLSNAMRSLMHERSRGVPLAPPRAHRRNLFVVRPREAGRQQNPPGASSRNAQSDSTMLRLRDADSPARPPPRPSGMQALVVQMEAFRASARSLEGDCPICRDRLTFPFRLSCGHVFCFECLSDWLLVGGGRSCPMDRSALQAHELEAFGVMNMPFLPPPVWY